MSLNKYLLVLFYLSSSILSTILVVSPASSENNSSAFSDLKLSLRNLEKDESEESDDDDYGLGSQNNDPVDEIEGSTLPNNSSDDDDDEGLGSRGECNQYADLPPMRLIVPDSTETLTTQEAFPSFFVYLPFDLRSTDYGLFVLESESGRALYRQEFRSLQGGGILRIDLEEAEDLLRTGAGLSADTEYNWSFSVSCEGSIINVAQETGASVTRVSSSVDMNSWYDVLDAAAAAYESGSSDNWSNLLQLNGFEDISSDPFLPTD